MRLVRRSLVLLLLVVLSLLTAAVAAAQPPSSGPDVAADVTAAVAATGSARVLIALRDPVAAKAPVADRAAAVAQTQAAVLAAVPPGELRVLRRYSYVPALAGVVTPVGLAALQARPEVSAVHLDERSQGHQGASAPALGADLVRQQYGLTGQGIAVAVLDSGIDTDHPDLKNDIAAQHCFTSAACPPNNLDEGTSAEDANGHGTNVAGIISGDGVVGPMGVAPGAKIVAVRVLDNSGSGWVSDWIAGLDWIIGPAAALNIRLVNLSLGTYQVYQGTCDADIPTLGAAVSLAAAQGIAIFASSGNGGSATSLSAPACHSGVIAVGATYDVSYGREPDTGTWADLFGSGWPACFDAATSGQTITCFTNSNAKLSMLAPGARITSSGMGGGTATYIGTSQAAPGAVGVAALLLQARPALTIAQLESLMHASGTAVTDPKNGRSFPLLNALRAVQSLPATATPTPTPTPTPGPRAVSGRVDLQGRGDDSGARVQVGAVETTTQADGAFRLTVAPGAYVATVSRAGYLSSQTAVTVNGTADVTLPLVTLRSGDVNGDTSVNLFDLVIVSSNYGNDAPPADTRADLNGDGSIGLGDLILVATNYGRSGGQAWGAGAVERGAWSVERGAAGVESRAWSVERGTGSVERGAWSVERGTESGEDSSVVKRRNASGERGTESEAGSEKRAGLTLVAPKMVKTGEEFAVVVRAAGQTLDGVDITLMFDPSRAVPLGPPTVGSGLGGERAFVARASMDVEAGQARLAAVRLPDTDAAGGDVLVLRLRGVRDGAPGVRLGHVGVVGMSE